MRIALTLYLSVGAGLALCSMSDRAWLTTYWARYGAAFALGGIVTFVISWPLCLAAGWWRRTAR